MHHIVMCEKVEKTMFMYISDCSKTQAMCDTDVEQNSRMLKFVLGYFETRGMWKKLVKKSLLAIMHIPEQHKTQQMCEKVISENPGMLPFIPNYYKTQKIYVKKHLIIVPMH